MSKPQVMQFDDGRPEVGDYIEFTNVTQPQYNVSWYCSDVLRITADGGYCVRYDNGNTIHYIDDFLVPYISNTYGNMIYRVKPR